MNISAGAVASSFGSTILSGVVVPTLSSVAAIESLVLVNRHIFLPIMENATKTLYGVLGEDPLRTEQELKYARENYFEPVFKWVENANQEMKNMVEDATGIDLDRDGGVG